MPMKLSVLSFAVAGLAAVASSSRIDVPRLRGDVAYLSQRNSVSNGAALHDGSRVSSRVRSGIEDLEEWVDGGRAIQGALSVDQLNERMSSLTDASFHGVQSSFVNVASSRFVVAPGNAKAASYLKEKLQGFGFTVEDEHVQVNYQQYATGAFAGTQGPTTGNIIAYMKGTDLASELVVFGAHYDSVNWKDVSGDAPGADDNGSGEAALLLIAQALAAENKARPLRRSVALVSFQAEEVGLVGSKQFVVDAVKSGRYGTPVAAIIADEISFSTQRKQYAKRAIFETKGRVPANIALVDTLAHAAGSEKGILGFEVNYNGFGSDHIPFLNAGYPAVLLIERDNMYFADNWGHTSEDTMDKTDSAFGSSMARLAARTVLTLAHPASTNLAASL